MTTFSKTEPLRDYIKKQKKAGNMIAFVPTMGALHKGHTSLIELARKEADEVVVSIYVNPTQFGPDEDFEEYPRTLDEDLQKCERLDVDAVFTPTDKIMYNDRRYLTIEIDNLNKYMDGGSRPGFFEGIATVVNKFFNIIEPDVAVFGQKDIQQFRILQQMVHEFNHDVELKMSPIIRANDGLALSSRNAYLDSQQRSTAPALYRSLNYLKEQILDGAKNFNLLFSHQQAELEAKGLKIDYLNLFSLQSIAPVESTVPNEKYILAGAVYCGETRLIDNMIFEVQD